MTGKIVRSGEGEILMGGRQTIKLRSEATDGKIAILFSVVPRGGGIPVHVHEHDDEMFEIIEGELEVTLAGSVHVLLKGDLVFLPRSIPHSFKALSNTSMWVSLSPGGGEKMFVELAALPPGPPDMEKVSRICAPYGITFTDIHPES